jgi:hypothetical protein
MLQDSVIGRARLDGVSSGQVSAKAHRSTWEALLVAVLPRRFDPNLAGTSKTNVIDLLRRAGYPFSTPGEFYASAIKYFTVYLVAAAIASGILVILGLGVVAPFLAAGFIYIGLTRPYANLRTLAKKRADALRNNMLVGLAVFESLLAAGQGVQESMRAASKVGGPFCNLMGLLVARMEIEPHVDAIETTRAHVPDPDDIDMQLFLRDIYDHFVRGRPILSGITALRVAVHRNILEATEKRTSVVLQRTSLLGIFAIVGLILSIILPFMNM